MIKSVYCRLQILFVIIHQIKYSFTIISMPNQWQPQANSKKRQSVLLKLSKTYQKIPYMEFSQEQYPTKMLQSICILNEYDIRPKYATKQVRTFYHKFTEYYQKNACILSQQKQQKSITKHLKKQSIDFLTSTQNQVVFPNDQQLQHQEIILKTNQHLTHNYEQSPTEANQSAKKIQLIEQKLSKNYFQIKQFMKNFDQKQYQNQSLYKKVKMLNAWTVIPSKIQDFQPSKEIIRFKSPSKKLETYSKTLKKGSIKDVTSPTQIETKTIILGKNQSTQTKQIKHMLRVQAKTNFVQQKIKEQQKLNCLQKSSIQLTYLLNIITMDYFQGFSIDILRILRENSEVIPILSLKVIEKIKDEHNFIETYIALIKKLCKSDQLEKSIKPESNVKPNVNQFQITFVKLLQKSFCQLVSQKVLSSPLNFNEYKYQKQIIGINTFIGKLIKQGILSKKIFKACFWEIVHRYVQKVKQTPLNDIVNQCLISGIVLMSDCMGRAQLLKLKQKRKSQKLCEIDQNRLQKMVEQLVNPNDEDIIQRQNQCQNLINTIGIQDYPIILLGLVSFFGSKRMKLKFVIESWQQRMTNLEISNSDQSNNISQATSVNQKLNKKVPQQTQQLKIISEGEIKEIEQLIECMKQSSNLKTQLTKISSNFIKILKESKYDKKLHLINHLTKNYLCQFADTSHHNVMLQRVQFFINLIDHINQQANWYSCYQKVFEAITKVYFEQLMIIQCDFPFMVEGVCKALLGLMKNLDMQVDETIENIKKNLNSEDEDMVIFFEKVKDQLIKLKQTRVKQD